MDINGTLNRISSGLFQLVPPASYFRAQILYIKTTGKRKRDKVSRLAVVTVEPVLNLSYLSSEDSIRLVCKLA